ncbi:MAG: zinc-ribbon domain-containing protein [Burkholderiaceae bacterium]|nr:zinc-ribbon domain-containing protein [Burkholderiaceae bacterium]
MALATQCPHCQTTFRVAHDQLKLRAGLVRCGYCKEIFNGIENLLPSEDAAASTPAPATPAAPAVVETPSVPATPVAPVSEVDMDNSADTSSASAPDTAETETDEAAIEDQAVEEEPEVAKAPAASKIDFEIPAGFERDADVYVPDPDYEANKPEDPLQRMTLLDFTRELPDEINAENTASTYDPNELDQAINDLQRKPWRGSRKSAKAATEDALDEVDADDEPDFLKRGRRKQRLSRKLRIFLSVSCFILLIAALLQGTYIFRNQIAGWFPQAKPTLISACELLGCRIDLPAQIDQVSIESSELQTLANDKDTFVLTTLLRNYSSTYQEWPHIELTLNDTNEKALLRRVFTPADYLNNSEDVRIGFSANSERSVKLSFELSQLKASGYRVYLFYP